MRRAGTRRLLIGNWKMNGSLDLLRRSELIESYAAAIPDVELGLCVPFPYLAQARASLSAVSIGAQDCDVDPCGARTGRVAAAMLAEVGAVLVIVGHSETRNDFGLADVVVAHKAAAALAAGLRPIVCVGEKIRNDVEKAEATVAKQLKSVLAVNGPHKGMIVAYEPVWAIATGTAADKGHVEHMHTAIARILTDAGAAPGATPILYGGSVDEKTAATLIEVQGVDGFLVGGASLHPGKFSAIGMTMTSAVPSLASPEY